MIYHLHSFLTLWGEELCWPGLYQTYLISFLVKADGFREFKIMGREEIYSALKAMGALGRDLVGVWWGGGGRPGRVGSGRGRAGESITLKPALDTWHSAPSLGEGFAEQANGGTGQVWRVRMSLWAVPLRSSEAAVGLTKAPSSEERPGWLCFPGQEGQRPNLSHPPFLGSRDPGVGKRLGLLHLCQHWHKSEEIPSCLGPPFTASSLGDDGGGLWKSGQLCNSVCVRWACSTTQSLIFLSQNQVLPWVQGKRGQ